MLQNTAGESLAVQVVNEGLQKSPCYEAPKHEHRWQGDVYSSRDFAKVPTPHVPYWMLLNRTCHLVEDKNTNRGVKIPYLVYCTVIPITAFVNISESKGNPTIKNQVSNLVNNKNEGNAFLPARPESGINEPLIVDFNMVYSFPLSDCPTASQKVLQLSSPFAEHIIQRFSRWFYTVGYDDSELKSSEYIDAVVQQIKDQYNTSAT